MSDSYEEVDSPEVICQKAKELTIDEFKINCLSYGGEY